MRSETVNKILHQTRDIYNKIAPQFSNTRSREWRGFENFNNFVKPGQKVLDLGCGNGRMATIFDDKIKYVGIDNSEELIKIAIEKFEGKKNVNFKLGDIVDLNFKVKDFNLVLMIAVLHHVPTKKLRLKILKNINKIMLSGAHLIIYNWNLWQLGQKTELLEIFI